LAWVGDVGASGFLLIVGFYEDGGEEADDERFIGEETRDAGAALDFAIDALAHGGGSSATEEVLG